MIDSDKAHDMIKSVYIDGVAEINGREYKFSKMTHKQRRKVFAFYTSIISKVKRKDFSFLDSDSFESVEAVINNVVSFDDSLLSRIDETHWNKHPNDYVPFITTALAVISYPLLQGRDTA